MWVDGMAVTRSSVTKQLGDFPYDGRHRAAAAKIMNAWRRARQRRSLFSSPTIAGSIEIDVTRGRGSTREEDDGDDFDFDGDDFDFDFSQSA